MFVLVAGPIAAGKTTFAIDLAAAIEGRYVSVRQALHDILGGVAMTRAELQRHGAELDRRTGGRWLFDHVTEQAESIPNLVIDSLRTQRQTLPLLDDARDCVLVYLDAHNNTRRRRYASAAAIDVVKAAIPFDEAMNHPTEQQVRNLKPLAHIVIETDDLSVAALVHMAIVELELVKDL